MILAVLLLLAPASWCALRVELPAHFVAPWSLADWMMVVLLQQSLLHALKLSGYLQGLKRIVFSKYIYSAAAIRYAHPYIFLLQLPSLSLSPS